jgi:hypothetical protein
MQAPEITDLVQEELDKKSSNLEVLTKVDLFEAVKEFVEKVCMLMNVLSSSARVLLLFSCSRIDHFYVHYVCFPVYRKRCRRSRVWWQINSKKSEIPLASTSRVVLLIIANESFHKA